MLSFIWKDRIIISQKYYALWNRLRPVHWTGRGRLDRPFHDDAIACFMSAMHKGDIVLKRADRKLLQLLGL